MDVSATNAQGVVMRYVDATVNGHNIYMIGINGAGNLIADQIYLSGNNTIVATGTTVN